jgi:hypothetical protein
LIRVNSTGARLRAGTVDGAAAWLRAVLEPDSRAAVT